MKKQFLFIWLMLLPWSVFAQSDSDQQVQVSKPLVALVDGARQVNVTLPEFNTISFTASHSQLTGNQDNVEYQWEQLSGPNIALVAGGNRATFKAPEVDDETQFSFRLTVKGELVVSEPAVVNIYVNDTGVQTLNTGLWP